jgi:uncharacterized protein YndB with AHSA1/START domain
MANDNEDLGTIRREGGQFTATLERQLDHSPTKVWAMLTEPDRLVEWLAPGTIELHEGGAAKLDFGDSGILIDSTVTTFEQERIIEYSWSNPGEPLRPLRFEVEPEDDGCRLKMSLKTPVDEDIARSCAGWEAHLMMLLAALEGVPIKFPFERFQSSREAYNDMVPAA